MSSILRRAAVIPALQFTTDVSTFLALRALGVPYLIADGIAVTVASSTEYACAAQVTRHGDPSVGHVGSARATGVMWAASLVTDLSVLSAARLLTIGRVRHGEPAAKVLACGTATIARFVAQRAILAPQRRSCHDNHLEPAPPTVETEFRLSVVIPAFCEAERIGTTISALRAGLHDVCGEKGFEIIVVDDGSTDETAAVARASGADVVITHAHNRGKGAAVRTGVFEARGAVIAFTDADLAYGPVEITHLLEAVEAGAEVAVGNRHHPASRADRSASLTRVGASIAFNWATRLLLVGTYADTQCGVKAFRSDVAHRLFSVTKVDGFAFDVELFHLFERYGYRVVEIPVSMRSSTSSTVTVIPTALGVVRDIARIRRSSGRGEYDDSTGNNS